MRQSEIIEIIEQTAPLSIAAGWDNSGLQVASARERVASLAVCLDPTPESIRQALEQGAEMVLSHHPLSMTPFYVNRMDSRREALALLFRADVPLYAAHTSLDANPRGPVSWLAGELGLTDLRVLEETGHMGADACGFGVVGTLGGVLESAKMARMLEPWITGTSRLVGQLPAVVRTIAICPGSGGDLASEAAALGADVFITGDLKYHAALDFPLPVLDVGHFCLEEEMMRRFAAQLQDSMPDVAVSFIPARDPFAPFPQTRPLLGSQPSRRNV